MVCTLIYHRNDAIKCSVVLTFQSVDKILWCDHSNETSSAVPLHGTICFSIFYKMKFGTFLEFGRLALLGVTDEPTLSSLNHMTSLTYSWSSSYHSVGFKVNIQSNLLKDVFEKRDDLES